MSTAGTHSLPAPANIVRPTVWTLARVNATRLDGLRRRIAETQARSTTLAAGIVTLASTGADPVERTRQLWDALDTLERLRIEQWVLSQEAPR